MTSNVMTTVLCETAAPASATMPTDDEDALDLALSAIAEPVDPKASVGSRLSWCAGVLASTPKQASMLTLWIVCVLVMSGTLLAQPSRDLTTELGPAKVRCGLDIYLYGYPDATVATACRDALTLNLALFVPAAIFFIVGLLAAGLLVVRKLRRMSEAEAASQAPTTNAFGIAPALIGAGAAVVGLIVLRPVPIAFISDGATVTADCGVGSYFGALSGLADESIARRCRDAYADRGLVLLFCLLLLVLATVMLLRRLRASTALAASRSLRIRLTLVVVVLSAVAMAALVPIAVTVGQGPSAQVVNCGLDTFLGGSPERAVEAACRSSYRGHAVVGLLALLAAVAIGAWGALKTSRMRYPREDPRPRHEGQYQV